MTRIIFFIVAIFSLSFAFRVQHSNEEGLHVKLRDTMLFIKDLKNLKGLRNDIDQSRSENFVFFYKYFFRVNTNGNVEPKVYFNTSKDKFLAVAEYIEKKFNHYKWSVKMPKKINLYNESAALSLIIESNASEDSVNLSITQMTPTVGFKSLREKTLYKINVAYKDLK
ncbi:hypothetical protein [Mucilaginibacter sp. 44-25]|uniref:hypothetical protein n=1 Tax=Mucilaginibacter sp. 44-25 TaxID=1895794 RepID=UPI0009639FC6|nr:hypothetical protein [Mucilaginibacter sp. 44-25]OJW17947.1 MAG: hypothetical protein BGO48_15300 [Mucilaginibacter sp. 44-25]